LSRHKRLEKFLLHFTYEHQSLNQHFLKAGKSAKDLSQMLKRPAQKEKNGEKMADPKTDKEA
jgi:hypothetical protein